MKQVTVYKLSELKDVAPEAFAKVHEEWRRGIDHSGDVAWQQETMDSLKAVVKACGARLRDWSIGPDDPQSFLKVDVDDTVDNEDTGETGQKDAAWLWVNVLQPHGYKVRGEFPGECPWTGYCADEDFIEQVYKRLDTGDTLTEALESLADKAAQMMQSDLEQDMDEETMLANWGEREYTIDGLPVN